MLSVPFGCNPMIHYKRLAPKLIDYAFIGTMSPLKVQETKDYMLQIFVNNEYKGIFGGYAWGMGLQEVENLTAVKLYSIATICPNYHLKFQHDNINEVNDRTFAIPACGEFQISDNPKAMSVFFEEDEMCTVNNPEEYKEKFEYYLHSDNDAEERMSYTLKGMNRVFKEHTMFHRLTAFLEGLYGKIE